MAKYNGDVLIGSTVHVVPVDGRRWQVVDPRKHVFTFPSRAAAVAQAKVVAAARQPSQVVLFDELGRLVPIARYQLPRYPAPHLEEHASRTLFEAAAKVLVIDGLLAAGVAVSWWRGLTGNCKEKLRSREAVNEGSDG